MTPKQRATPTPPIDVPPYYWPHPAAKHPDTEEARLVANDFLDRHRLYADDSMRHKQLRTENGRFAGYAMPAAVKEAVFIYAKFTVWGFAYDDEVLDERPTGIDTTATAIDNLRIMRTAEITEYPPALTHKYGLALREIRMDIDSLYGPEAGQQFIDLMYTYTAMELNIMAMRQARHRPTIDEYLTCRMYQGGAHTYPSLAIILNGHGLRPEHIADRRVRALREIVALLGGWTNDIYAYSYERDNVPAWATAIDILRDTHGYTYPQGVRAAMDVHDRCILLFDRISDQLLDDDHDLYAPVVHTLRDFHGGHLAWVTDNTRYVNKQDLSDTYHFGGYGPTTRPADPAPLPYPYISWWWERNGTTTSG
ncbi:terpene synthase family protein [Streptomyces sp. NPDC057654]|uniref:terpene synthase family protein n=1 Tax=Streptomyces sp. NPDC057654 TaxID=3346196 RepID=UPI00369E77DB